MAKTKNLRHLRAEIREYLRGTTDKTLSSTAIALAFRKAHAHAVDEVSELLENQALVKIVNDITKSLPPPSAARQGSFSFLEGYPIPFRLPVDINGERVLQTSNTVTIDGLRQLVTRDNARRRKAAAPHKLQGLLDDVLSTKMPGNTTIGRALKAFRRSAGAPS